MKDADGNEMVEEGQEEQIFGDVFNEAAGTAGQPPAEVKEEPVKPIEPQKVEQKTEQKIEQKPNESDEAYKQRWQSLQGIYRHEKDEWSNEKQKLLTELEAAKKQVAAPVEEKNKKPDIIQELLNSTNLTDEQRKELEDYDIEFDVVSKFEGLKRKTEMAKLKAELLESIDGMKKELLSQYEPLAKTVNQTVADREEAEKTAHFEAIGSAFPDFEKWRDDGSVETWIESKPSYMKDGLKAVCANGTTQQIIDLLGDFAKENNISVAPADKSNVVPINAKKAERKAALISPISKKGAVNLNSAISEGYEDAFDEIIAKEQQKR